MLKYFILILACLFSVSASAQDYKAELKRSAQLGLLLYEFDSSAWVATDALREKKKTWQLFTETASPKGWVTTEVDKNRLRTAFIAELDGKLVSVFDAETKGRKVKKKTTYPNGRPLTEAERIQLLAKQAFTIDDIEPCAEFLPMNTIVIPSDNDEGQFLYVMSATKRPDLAIVGRHFRFNVSKDGRSLSNRVSFSNGCLGLSKATPNGARPVGLMTSHIKTAHPQEHHVFLSLVHDVPLFVMTTQNNQVWKVDGTKIKPVDMSN